MTPAELKERLSVPAAFEDLLDVPIPDSRKIRCPWHEDDTASLHVYDDHWWCYGCGRGGDVIQLLIEAMGRQKVWAALEGDFFADLDINPDLVKRRDEPKVLEDFGTLFHFDASRGDAEAAQAWIAERWPVFHLASLNLIWSVAAGPYSLLIPHFDHYGVIRGVKTRATVGGQKGRKSAYPGSCFTTRLYQPSLGQTDLGTALLLEGESDAWHAYKVMSCSVYALPSGAGVWKDHWVADLASYCDIWICFDPDRAGEAARERASERLKALLPDTKVRHLHVPDKFADFTEAVMGGWDPNEEMG